MTPEYSQIRIRLHWLTLLLVAIQFLVQGGMVETMKALRLDQTPTVGQFLLSNLHLSCGVLILILTLYRLVLRLRDGPVSPPPSNPQWMTQLATTVHWLFYILLVLMPVSGALAYYRVAEFATDVHVFAKWVLVSLLILHVLAALAHLIWRKDGVWRRMVQWRAP